MELKLPEEIFPLEVWGMILKNLESPLDELNCSRTCKAWAKLLEKKKKTYLMTEVFPILRKYLDSEKDNDSNQINQIENPNPDPVLIMRLVCKAWKFGVDNDIQNDRNHTNIGFDSSLVKNDAELFRLRPSPPTYGVYKFSSFFNGDLDNWFSSGFDPDTNPFISRFVSYDDRIYPCYSIDGRRVEDFQRNFTTLLNQYGSHIWHAILNIHVWEEDIPYNQKRAYKLVKGYLDLMPNLRTLQVMFSIDVSIDITHSALRQPDRDVNKLLERKPLPKLVHLTTLTMKDVPAPLESGLLMKNQHVQKLSFQSTPPVLTIAAALPDFINTLQMENLDEWQTSINCEDDLVTLQTLPWSVNSLRIHFENLTLDSCFQSVSAARLSSTLKHLIVVPLEKEDVVIGRTGKLGVPHLKTLEMIVPANLKNIDFLTPNCTTLVNLQLNMVMDGRKDADKIHPMTTRLMKKKAGESLIQYDGYTSRMYESNIWTHLPALKRLKIAKKFNCERESPFGCPCCPTNSTIKKCKFTRGGYNGLQRNQN
ncbi:hypothetical protein Ocin01_00070 [Orchesella cincta]|uniref:F-box domain-containing protein n=1 Tax=Orchesella cincta TaxID=48709 RepID=A0A1D2NMV6_ORCCI|nr:hypothetical protein Ocin01_00070 [Orchesella cincta]